MEFVAACRSCRSMPVSALRWFLLLLVFPQGCSRPGGQGGHPEPAAPDPASITVVTDKALLYLEYPHLAQGESARFLAHVTARAGGEPVRSGEVVLEIGSTRLVAARPKRDGLFVPEGACAQPGRFPGRLTVTSPQLSETLDLGEIVVHPGVKEAHAAAQAAAGDAPENGVPFLMEQQWKVTLLLARAGERSLVHRVTVPAQVVTAEGRAAVVTPPAEGRLVAPPAGRLPRTGDKVEAGQLLGAVEPPLRAPELAQLQALRLERDLKALDVERELGSARARLRSAERERERIGKLREQGLGTQPQLEQAEQNLALARSDEQAALGIKASLDKLLGERESGVSAGTLSLPLQAPIAGTVLAASHVEGESVTAGATLFRIVDSAVVWIEGRVSEFDLPAVRDAAEASASLPALGGETLRITGDAGRLISLGQEVDPISRTLLVRYELTNAGGRLRPGMMAELALSTAKATSATAIPLEAVVMDQGIPTAYVMLEGEMFQKRELLLGIKDDGFVEVRSGIKVGDQVATRGAYAVKLAALSPASFGPGHQH